MRMVAVEHASLDNSVRVYLYASEFVHCTSTLCTQLPSIVLLMEALALDVLCQTNKQTNKQTNSHAQGALAVVDIGRAVVGPLLANSVATD
jgi:hypothetical protein